MLVPISCPTCSHPFRIPDQMVGHAVRCPQCSSVFTPPTAPPEDYDDSSSEDGRADYVERRFNPESLYFRLFVHNDPANRLKGTFKAELDAGGMRLWRGRGVVLVIPTRNPDVHLLENGRMLLPLTGRRIEVTPIHSWGDHEAFAQAIVEDLRNGTAKAKQPRFNSALWLALLPIVFPLLTLVCGLGEAYFLGWAVTSVFLGIYMIPALRRRDWPLFVRLLATSPLFLLSGIVLTMHVNNNRAQTGVTPELRQGWRPYAVSNSGFRVELPVAPFLQGNLAKDVKGGVYGWDFSNPQQLSPAHCRRYIVGYVERADRQGARILQAFPSMWGSNYRTRPAIGDLVVEEWTTHGRWRDIIAVFRVLTGPDRTFVLGCVGEALTLDTPEVRRFFDSFALDPTTGWPRE